jgi:hypothetical protein
MMALYMPMQPSSKTPMMALSRRNSAARRAPVSSARGGSLQAASGRTWLTSCRTGSPPAIGAGREKEIVGEILAPQSGIGTPALVSEPFRFSIPTRPGHSPLQLATVRMGPRWL